jgi:hypothetical protein
MNLIESKTLTSTQASIEFTSIPQTFDDLYLVISGRSGRTDFEFAGVTMSVNGNTSNQSQRFLRGMSGYGVDTSSSETPILSIPAVAATANTFGSSSIYIPNYRVAQAKSFIVDDTFSDNSNAGFRWVVRILALRWNDTSAINSLSFSPTGSWVSGSIISLYGITKGSSGGVVVS